MRYGVLGLGFIGLLAIGLFLQVGRGSDVRTEATTRPQDPLAVSLPVCESRVNMLVTCRAALTNISPKGVVAYGLLWRITWQDSHIERVHSISDRLLGGGKPFPPGEVLPSATFSVVGHGGQEIATVVVELEFVEFEDGSFYGDSESPGYRTLLGQRDGANLMRSRLRDIYLRGGIAALLKELDMRTP